MMRTAKTASLTRLSLRNAKRNSRHQHAVQDDEHLVGDRHNGAFWSSARSDSLEACLKHRPPFACRSPSALNQRRSQVSVAVCGMTAFLDASALALARAKPGPTGHLLRRRKRSHIDTGFRQNRRCSQLSDSRHRLEQRESVLKWCHPHALENFGIQDFQLFLQASEMTQRTTNQESLVVSHPMPLHCFDELRDLPLCCSTSQSCHLLGRRLPFQ